MLPQHQIIVRFLFAVRTASVMASVSYVMLVPNFFRRKLPHSKRFTHLQRRRTSEKNCSCGNAKQLKPVSIRILCTYVFTAPGAIFLRESNITTTGDTTFTNNVAFYGGEMLFIARRPSSMTIVVESMTVLRRGYSGKGWRYGGM